MPGFECEPLAACVMSLRIPTLAVCVRLCKAKHRDTAPAAQTILMEQVWAPVSTTFHLSSTELPEEELTAEPWRSPLPRFALTNVFNPTALPCVSAPVLSCAWLMLGSFFFRHREGWLLLWAQKLSPAKWCGFEFLSLKVGTEHSIPASLHSAVTEDIAASVQNATDRTVFCV